MSRRHSLVGLAAGLLLLSSLCAFTAWAGWRRLALPPVTAWWLAGASAGRGQCVSPDGLERARLSFDLEWEWLTLADAGQVVAWLSRLGWSLTGRSILGGRGQFELMPGEALRLGRLVIRQAARVTYGAGPEVQVRWEIACALC
jgi:hypothetical protein